MRIQYSYKYSARTGSKAKEIRDTLQYFDPLTRDFHVKTSTGLNTCESISIYQGLYDIPANDINHPYHLIT